MVPAMPPTIKPTTPGEVKIPAMVTFFISIMQLLKKYSDDFKENVSYD